MKKIVAVRTQKGLRYALRVFSVTLGIVPAILLIAFRELPVALVSGIPLFLILPALLYCETWQIRFGTETVEKRVLLWKKQYAYAQLRETVKGYYTSENGWCVRMYFTDGKCWKFRLNDENGDRAEKQLQKHCSFQIRN